MEEFDVDLCFNVAMNAVNEAGELIRQAFQKKKLVHEKSCDTDLVTETDQGVEKLLIQRVKENFPTHKFIGEESVAAGEKCLLTDDPTWIIDPVDVMYNKVAQIGIIYNPVLEQMYSAQLGKGALLNDKPIHVSKEKDLNKSLVLVEIGTSRDPLKHDCVMKNISSLTAKAHGLRSMGSAALNMASVASGGCDSYFEFGIHVWDIAAGDLIVREAGGVCIDTEGGPLDLMSRRMICASSQELASEIIPLLTQMRLERD